MNFYNFRKKRQILIFCFFALFLFSCGKEDIPRTVDSALEPYLDRFLSEGAKRGKTLNIDKSGGIIMEFADLTPPTIGLCYPSLPVRIQIDRTYWKRTVDSDNRENLREDVVFHELAHGFLGRRHRNDSLPNNEWTSMMCGEPQVNGRDWAVNFNGYRKDYYLDELFDVNTPVPGWSNPATFDGNNKGSLLDFTDYSSWSPSTDMEGPLTFKTGNGVYEISSFDNKSNLLSLYSNSPITGDFYMEVEMFVSITEGASGLFTGDYQSVLVQNHNYFTVLSNNRSTAGNTKCIAAPFAEVLVSDKFQKGSYNKFALCKKGEELFFYINDKLVYRNDYQLRAYNTFGVVIPAKGSVSIRNQALYSGSTLKAAKSVKDFSVIYGISIPVVDYLK